MAHRLNNKVPEGAQIPLSHKAIQEAPRMVCKKCKKGVYVQAFEIKVLSPLMNPTGQELLVPRQIGWWCLHCKKMVKELIKEERNERLQPNKNENKA